MAVAITKAPTVNVQGVVAPTRSSASSFEMVASWSVPDVALDQNRNDRATLVDIFWDLNLQSKATPSKTKKVRIEQRQNAAKRGTQAMNPNGVRAKDGTSWFRSSYYPTTDWLLTGVTAYVHTRNPKGAHAKWVPATRKFAKPKPPTVTGPTDNESGVVTATFAKVDPAQGEFSEALQHHYELAVYDSRSSKTVPVNRQTGAQGGSRTCSYPIADNQSLANTDHYILVRATGYAQGYMGNSDTVTKDLYVSYPKKPTIKGVSIPNGYSSTDRAVVTFSNNATKEHPVTGCRIEYIADTEYDTATSIPGRVDWVSYDVADDGSCTALSVLIQSLIPSPKHYSWLRVKTWNRFEGVYSSYSEPYRLTQLETEEPTVGDSGAVIASAISGDDGKSAEVLVVWDPQDGSSGTELSWSESPHAWRSNDGPDAFEVGWSDGQATVGQVTWGASALVHVSGLSEGTRYWLRSRRFLDPVDGYRVYGSYYPDTGEVTVTPMTSPTAVVLTAPKFVADGESLPLSWSYDSGSAQTSWQVVTGTPSGQGIDPDTLVVVDSGTDALGSHTIEPGRVASLMQGGSARLAVMVSTGGEFVTSQGVDVGLSVRPEVTVTAAQATAQPASITIGCTTDEATVAVIVTSQGISGDTPRGEEFQAAGDTVWSDVLSPAWEGSGPYTATVEMPPGLPLMDGATYTVRAVATDPMTGLASEESVASFDVDWARKAPYPSEVTSVEPYSTDGEVGARIDLVAPDGASETDVMDVYRLTPDGPQAVAQGVPVGSLVTDSHAPFGSADLAYRVAVRTTDGSEEWLDIPYELVAPDVFANVVRIDFGTDHVELERGTGLSDTYTKPFEARRHLDGTTSGYWDHGIGMRSSASSMVIRVYEQADDRLLRRLAAYEGPVLVRTGDGLCYEANADVNSISTSGTSAKESVSVTLTRVVPTAYMATYEEQE